MDKGTIITGLVGIATALFGYVGGKKTERAKARKIDAEAEGLEIGNIEKQISIYQTTLDRLEKEVLRLTKQVDLQAEEILALKEENKMLHEELADFKNRQ
jgi:peptidoglycan hydrolase CwlO-like protein